ncbi:MAG: nucleotidyl transferase AbiEii/AbiGii toxin family protein [Candidatus Acidiferrum sp.]
MIDRAEILRLANEFGLEARIVEKDYILGWVLAGIYRDPLLAGTWIFKGGTCLKKCFLETYRFSEDLDFTLTDATQLDATFLEQRFLELSNWLYETVGIELPPDQRRFEIYNNRRGGRCCEGRVGYRGLIAPRASDLPRVKLDLTADEIVVLPTVLRPVGHAYSDAPAEGITARCYAFEELFGEKVRALGERSRPRDLYDVINLFRNGESRAAAAVIRFVIQQKCTFKNIGFPRFEALAVFREELVAEWGNMLGHQLPALPPVDSFWNALPEFFGWLGGTHAPATVAPYPLATGEQVLRMPAGAFRVPGRSTPLIEVIRFAAANHLCVDLDYVGEDGRRGTRTIEPYSLRRTQEGNVVLHAVRSQNRQHRSYRFDRILGARITQQTFIPRYTVELTPSGPLAVAQTAGRGAVGSGWGGQVRQSRLSGGPVYVFRCPVCNKRFERKSYDATLRPHKNRSGGNCYGRYGHYEQTRH